MPAWITRLVGWWRTAAPVVTVIVEAVGTASASKGVKAAEIEAAMTRAVEDCLREGIGDVDVIRARKLAAREYVKAQAQ